MKQLTLLLALFVVFQKVGAKSNEYVFSAMLGDVPVEIQFSVVDNQVSAQYVETNTKKTVSLKGTTNDNYYSLEEFDEHHELLGKWTVEMYQDGCIWGTRNSIHTNEQTVIWGLLESYQNAGISGVYQEGEGNYAIFVERDPAAFQFLLHFEGNSVAELDAVAFWLDESHTTAIAEIDQETTPNVPCTLYFYINKNSIEIKETNPCNDFRGAGASFESKLWKRELKLAIQ